MDIVDEYWDRPQGTYESRKRAFLDYAAAAEGSGGRGGLFSQICRMEIGTPVDEDSIRSAISYVDERHDCADFTVSGLLRIVYKYRDSALLSDTLKAEIDRCLLEFKYWIDEPGKELMCYWSENHQIMFHSDQYLAGQHYPDQVFSNIGETGRSHVQAARPRILRWIDLKARTGFSEWDSNVYYDEDMTPLLNLADFSADEEIRTRAAMILDVMFFDMAVDSYRGTYGTSHGRTYPGAILSGKREATSGVQKIAWGMGCFNNPNNMTAVSLATSTGYRVPEVITSIAQDMPDELINRERHSLTIADCDRYGIRVDDPDTAMMMWGSGFATQKPPSEALPTADAFESHRFSVVIRPYAEAIWGTYAALDADGIEHGNDLGRQTLSQVNKYTYRTPDYQLSSAQDYRKGKPGFQQHIWQATLDSDAIVFAMNRGNEDEEVYKYWVGRFPRVAQHRNLLIALFDIPDAPLPGPKTVFPPDASGNAMPSPGPCEEDLLDYTVAVFRREMFDEILEKDHWVFGRYKSGYIALWSRNKPVWSPDGVLKGEGLRASGRRNVWICLMGRAQDDGSFELWANRVAGAPIEGADLMVAFQAPGIGSVSFDWDGDLTIDGQPASLSGYKRFDNPYAQTDFEAQNYEISCKGRSLDLDFSAGTRKER